MKKLKIKCIVFIIFGVVILIISFIGTVGQEKTKNIYCIEDKDYPKIENAYYGEWEILYSETVTNEGKAYMQNGDRVIIKEDEIVIEGDVLKNIRFDGTLASNLDGREYFDFFKEYNYVCPYFDWMPKGNFYLYIIADNDMRRMALCMSEENHMVIRYGESIYYCEKMVREEQSREQYFAGRCRMHDFGLDGKEIFEGKWVIDEKIVKNKNVLSDSDLEGREIFFFRSDVGKIRMSFDGRMYRKVGISMDIIGRREGQALSGYGSFEELGLTGSLIPYVQLELDGTDINVIRGFSL